MSFFSSTYNALRGPTGAPQTPLETIRRLSDRLSPSTLLADRRAAVLALKGLSRDCKADVGENALPGLLEVLENDAELDADIGKAVLETLNTLCDTGSGGGLASPGPSSIPPDGSWKALGLRHTDSVLANDGATQKLFTLLGDTNFYVQYSTLQLLGTLLHNRRSVAQNYFLKAQNGPTGILSTLDSRREMIRNEGLTLLQSFISQSPDIQKLFAFTGAFEKLFAIIRQEGGVDGGIVVHDCLACIDGLLRLNVSNQTFFRETGLAPFLTSLLYFPTNITLQEQAPQEFALQFWEAHKTTNVGLIVGILGLLIGAKGSNEAEANVFTRCLVEMALASNAPTVLKTQALRLLPANRTFPLASLVITPYVPVPETNGEEWDRLEPSLALDVLIELVTLGEYAGLEEVRQRSKEALQLRTAGLSVLGNYVRKEEVRFSVLSSLLPSDDRPVSPASVTLFQHLSAPPSTPLNQTQALSTHLASLLFGSLIASSSRCKQFALSITPSSIIPPDTGTISSSGNFFVPADGVPPAAEQLPEPDEDELPQTLLSILTEHLSLSLLSRARLATSDMESERDARAWDRLIVSYLTLLAQWLWEDPKAVREFLDSGGMGMLVEPINLTNDVDPVVQGLCSFLLGVCYEYNREPGEITRATIHAIFNRLSVDALLGRMARVREDERFKSIGPDDILVPYRSSASLHNHGNHNEEYGIVDLWFDWAFVDFWKSNYYTIQRSITLDPDTLASSSSENAEASMLTTSLREVIRNQAAQLEELRKALSESEKSKEHEVSSLKVQLADLSSGLETLKQKSKDAEKEQEDLLVFLEEVSTKRRRDKERLRVLGQEVSEDEGDDGDGGDEDDDGS